MPSPSKMNRIIVVRNSPNWKKNADIWLKTGKLDTKYFLPNPLPPGFPEDTESLILRWNKLFQMDFFSVRNAIKEMAARQLQSTDADHIIQQHDFEKKPEKWIKDSVIFFTDDDDFVRTDIFDIVTPYLRQQGCIRWPSPILSETLINRRVEKWLPVFRMKLQHFCSLYPRKLGWLRTLAASKKNLTNANNIHADFLFQTNNAAMNLTGLSSNMATRFVDHVHASNAILNNRLPLHTIDDTYLSFTNKLPSAITYFRSMVCEHKSDIAIKVAFSNYVQQFATIALPNSLNWAKVHQKSLVELFTKIH